MILQSTITCPNCGNSKIETMLTDACRFFYNCASCGTGLKPKAGDCCVFCSYGDVPCPPMQEAHRQSLGVIRCLARAQSYSAISFGNSLIVTRNAHDRQTTKSAR
jgi:hypothetical protein